MSKKPGVMIYFDARPPKMLHPEDRLALYDAILDYAESGTLPELEGAPAVAWAFLKNLVDRDDAAYERKCALKRHGAYCRECKNSGIRPLSFNRWLESGEISAADTLQAVTSGGCLNGVDGMV